MEENTEKIICMVTPERRTYYKAEVLAKQFLDKDHNIVNTVGKIPDGKVTQYEVATKTVKHLRDGKLDGIMEIVDLTSNTVTFREVYKDGVLEEVADRTIHGVNLKSEIEKKIPMFDGTLVKVKKGVNSFYLEGKEIAEETVSAAGATIELLGKIPDGPAKEFDDNGSLRAELTYKHNKLHGSVKRYADTGELISEENYKNGLIQGEANYYTYLKNNGTHSKAFYRNSVLEGERTLSFSNGKPVVREFFEHGKLTGKRTVYYQDGGINYEENYLNGKLNGARVLYFPGGAVWYKENYKNGRLDGDRISYFPSGQKRLEELYADGLLEGYRKIYAENGELLTTEEYHWGSLMSNTERKSL